MDALFGPVFGTSGVAAVTGDRAWLRALCTVEAALARAGAQVGLLDRAAAERVAAAAVALAEDTDPAELGVAAVAGGNPVIPLVALLRDRVGPSDADAAHAGATSQDVLDTALVLLTRDALGVLRPDLAGCAAAAARLAAAHRDTPMIARTLLQQALPTTFGALAATWGAGLDRAVAGIDAAGATLPAQLGGAAGTLAAWHPHGFALAEAFAAELGLPYLGVWHAERTRITALAGALGVAAAAVGSVATDVVLLAQTELGEVREDEPGGSSSMPHKQNAVAASTARAAAAQAPGLVATLLAGASGAELQRAAGGWHAEWPALVGLLRSTGGAANRLRVSLDGLHVDAAALARNLGDADPGTGHAADLVDRYLQERP